jgi:transcriptional regulator with XRE-family HTH domain
MIIEATGTPLRCLFANLVLKVKRPINPAYPRQVVTLGDHLRAARLDRCLLQTQVAKILKVAPDTVTGWELNRHEPPARMANKIIQFLGYVPSSGGQGSLIERFRQARQILGHSQEQAASSMRCDESNISRFERGTQNPMEKTRQKIERYIRLAEVKLKC